MIKECSLCGDIEEVCSENCFGFRYLCRDCDTFIFIRYNPTIYSYDKIVKEINKILLKMKDKGKFDGWNKR